MKSKWFKLQIIIFVLIASITINVAINYTKAKNSKVIGATNKTKITNTKNEHIKIQETRNVEIKKQQVLKQKQESLEKKWKKGYDEFFQKKYNQAIDTERQLLKEDPNFYKAYAVLGIALAYNGSFKNGMQQIDYALKLNPDYGYARFNKALANELYGNYNEAIIWYKKDLAVEKFEWSYYGIASIYGRKGDLENTIKYLNLAIAINPNIKNTAKDEEDFDNVKDSMKFKELLKK